MAMTYTSLVADKTVTGSIASWVNYSKLQPTVIVDEAQSLIWSLLRCREMLTSASFSMALGNAHFPLPDRFLDPIGRMFLTSVNCSVAHKDQNFIQINRTYDELSGTLGANPFTTVASSLSVNVLLANHGLFQDSVFNTSGATAFNGVTLNGTFPITAIIDTNNFTIDITSLGQIPSASGSGGGSTVNYLVDNLTQGIPVAYGIWDETIYFDVGFAQQSLCKLQYYQSLPLLTTSNQSNFLCTRYPQLMRTACVTAAADFMKDTEQYNLGLTRLQALVQRVSIENDGMLRGMELDPYIP